MEEEKQFKGKNEFLKEQGIDLERDFADVGVYSKVRLAMEQWEKQCVAQAIEAKTKLANEVKQIIADYENPAHAKRPCTKVKFGNEKFADEYIKKLKATSTRAVKPQRAYLCPHCTSWHLTSKTLKDTDAIELLRKKVIDRNDTISKLNDVIHELKGKNAILRKIVFKYGMADEYNKDLENQKK